MNCPICDQECFDSINIYTGVKTFSCSKMGDHFFNDHFFNHSVYLTTVITSSYCIYSFHNVKQTYFGPNSSSFTKFPVYIPIPSISKADLEKVLSKIRSYTYLQ